jgi:hypothetical protein
VIREELFQWFVDTIGNVKGRICSFIILAQAEIIAQDYRVGIALAIEKGEVDPCFEMLIPRFTAAWLFLWRRSYHGAKIGRSTQNSSKSSILFVIFDGALICSIAAPYIITC